MKYVVVAALVLLLGLQQELTHAQCSGLFASSGSVTTSDSADRLISYLSQLLESNAIGERELVTLREGANPIPHKQTEYGPVFETSARRIQYQVVQEHMQSGGLDYARIKSWAEQKLEETSEVRASREEVREETQSPYRRTKFHRLPPGKFEMGEVGKQVPVELTHSIEMMSTPITQEMWVDVMGENPSSFKEGDETIEVEINGERIRMQPDHPVENVTWFSVVVFANRLSEKHGLKPAYDLSGLRFKGRAEDGSLHVFGSVRIAAPDGDIYQAEGYRLPTEAEQEYVLRDLGRAKGVYPHDLTETELADYAWFENNSYRMTHAVGTTPKSLSVDGKAFDDLIGNVWEWSHDDVSSEGVKERVNPVGFGGRNIVRGGSYYSPKLNLRSDGTYDDWPGFRGSAFGARLVRTIDVESVDARPATSSMLARFKKWLGLQ